MGIFMFSDQFNSFFDIHYPIVKSALGTYFGVLLMAPFYF